MPFKKLQVPVVRVLKGFFNLKNKIMKKPERLIGKKVRGFKFEHFEIPFSHYMDNFIEKVGVIKEFINDNKACLIEFDCDNYFYYPADQIEAHLVEDEIPTLSDGVMMLVSDDAITWHKSYIFGKRKGLYLEWRNNIDTSVVVWNFSKPLEPTKEEQLKAILGSDDKVSEIMELFKN